jgi:hypothetical protein
MLGWEIHSHVILRQPNNAFAWLLITDIDRRHQASRSNVFEFVWTSCENHFNIPWKFIANLKPFLLKKIKLNTRYPQRLWFVLPSDRQPKDHGYCHS